MRFVRCGKPAPDPALAVRAGDVWECADAPTRLKIHRLVDVARTRVWQRSNDDGVVVERGDEQRLRLSGTERCGAADVTLLVVHAATSKQDTAAADSAIRKSIPKNVIRPLTHRSTQRERRRSLWPCTGRLWTSPERRSQREGVPEVPDWRMGAEVAVVS